MLKQFNPNFIDYHLIPFFQEVLKDAAENPKEYHKNLFINGYLTEREKAEFEKDYFTMRKEDMRIPFTQAGDQKERDQLITFFIEHIGNYSQDPLQRWKAFMPIQNDESELFVFHETANRNIHLMAYSIVNRFEKTRLLELVQEKKDNTGTKSQGEDEKLLANGELVLVKNEQTGDFGSYKKKKELKGLPKAVPLVTKPSEKTAKIIAGKEKSVSSWTSGAYHPNINDIVDEMLSGQELFETLEKKQLSTAVHAIKDQFRGPLTTSAIEVSGTIFDPEFGEIQVENGVAIGFMESPGAEGLPGSHIEIQARLLETKNTGPGADAQSSEPEIYYNFRFLSGPFAGQNFQISQQELQKLLPKSEAGRKTLEEIYKAWKERKTLESLEKLAQEIPLSLNKPLEQTLDNQQQKIDVTKSASSSIQFQSIQNKPSKENLSEQEQFFQQQLGNRPLKELPNHEKKPFTAPARLNTVQVTPMAAKARLQQKQSLLKQTAEANRSKALQQAYASSFAPKKQKQQQIRVTRPQKKRNVGAWIAALATGGAVGGTISGIVGGAYFSLF